MYSEWSSLPLEGGGRGVLGAVGGRDVVLAVVKQLASHEPSPLTTDAEVEWVLEVIRFGLSLPLQEHGALRDCVRVCCAWLAPLLPPAPPAMPPPPAIPPPVAKAPHKYARKILRHLHNLFVPRPNESGDLISKQAVLCHRVLRLARALADGGALGAKEWRSLLLLLLAAASALLSPPAPHHSAAEQLCERVLCVLFEVWILACHRCFPVPPLWRTLREQCVRWRHRAPLTEQWTRASLALTARLLKHMYGPLFPVMPISEEDANLIPADMSAEAVMQSWYRILHTIGNPVDLCRPHIISQTPDFLQYSITQDEGSRDPSQHPCLQALPSIFHKAMKGIAAHVDAFLGRGSERWWGAAVEPADDGDLTPPAHRRLAKSFSVSAARPRDKLPERSTPRTSLIGLTSSRPPSVAPTTPPNSISSQVGESEKPPLTPLRPKVNSIFHLFGEWLFEAALIGTTPAYNNQQRTEGTPPPPSLSDATYKLNMLAYQPARTEALTHLDLDGVLVLVPDFINALDQILSEREPKLECGTIDKRELRKAAISALLSLVAFPYHYKGLPVPEFPGCNEYAGMTLGDFTRGRISLICVSAVQVETSDALAVPLLNALYLCVRHNAHHAPSHAPGSTLSHNTEYKARSDSGSATGSGEGHSLDDFAADVRELDPSSPVFGAALVVRATYLVCHRLISSWKGDLQVSLAALELLSGLAKLHSSKPEAIERKRAVRWICDYITVQCSRPPQAHSRDLHSCVVAAYSCLAAWLCPALLADQECIATLLEVVELGISGSKSQGKPGEPPKMKDEKELKPVSMRVRDAAESLLMLILEQQIGNGGNGSSWCRLDERWLAALGHGKLRHFVADGNILLSLLEEPLSNSQEPQPTLIGKLLGTPVLVRGHPGWAGHVDTSYDARPHAPPTNREPAPAIYDAREQVLYWSDSTNEIAFVVPSGRDTTDTEDRNDSIKSDVDGSCLSNRSSDKGAGSCWDVSGSSTATGTYERSVSESERTADRGGKLADKLRALSLDLDKQPQAQLTGSGRRNRDYTTKILIIWLEDFEDHLNLPIDDLLTYCETGLPWRRHEVVTLCVSARRCGLVRLQCAAAGLLPDAALVAPALLSDCLRRAALDAARRTRLNTDLYQPPHVRRRHLIQELAQQYKKDLTEPELLESLFRPPE
ncbi:hypothetical protein B5X24_HaOG203542 [Helicoverpa armigera]|uniref:Ral GTPase-activating protein subunit alpha/beta N-terminal domain-containing protein n=1 Tax=Helicoverpa armigera TaxID=29058 RepID=A0A2W1BQM4_HELAM|nr:hypothetical protein B5X24_HaOG203542 [Helicoverpa armigera]